MRQGRCMARVTDIIQLAVSLAVTGLFWMIYPGVMVILAMAVGLTYVTASIGALRGSRLGGRVALALTLATAVLAALAVSRFVGNGFSYSSGNFDQQDGIYWLPYAFLAITIGAVLVLVLRLALARGTGSESQS